MRRPAGGFTWTMRVSPAMSPRGQQPVGAQLERAEEVGRQVEGQHAASVLRGRDPG